MARTKLLKDTKKTASTTDESTTEAMDYSKMTATELSKLLNERKIEGRSKLTKKETMIKVLELFDKDPEDKKAIASLVAELSTPRKRNTTKSETAEEEKPKKSRMKKEESSEEDTVEESQVEEKKEKKTKGKKTSDEPEEKEKSKKGKEKSKSLEDKPKKNKEKENAKDKTKTRNVVRKEEETSDESDSSRALSFNDALISDKEPSPSVIDVDMNATQKVDVASEDTESKIEEPILDTESTEKMSEREVEELDKKTKLIQENIQLKSKEVFIKEGKQEIPDDFDKSTSSEPVAYQSEMPDPDEDTSMIEIFKLTRHILRQMKYLTKVAQKDENFKESWTNTLMKLKGKFDKELELVGENMDDELPSQSSYVL